METSPTVSDIVAAYLRHLAASNVCGPEALAERFRTFCKLDASLGGIPVQCAKAFHLSDWVESHAAWRSSSTKKAKANQVNACFNWAVRQGRIPSNPFKAVNYDEAEPRPAMSDDAFEVLLRRSNKPFERAVRFLRLTGCRLSELCRLTWLDIDWDRRAVILKQHKARKKTGRPRVFALVDEAIQILVDIDRDQPQSYQGAIFLNTKGTSWNRRTLGQQLLRMKKRGEVKTLASLHGLRHALATEAVRNGAPIKAISLQLGHSSTVISEKMYVHLDADYDFMREGALAGLPR